MGVPERGEIERQLREARSVVEPLTRMSGAIEGRYDATKLMRVAATAFGFEAFMITRVASSGNAARLSDLIRLTTWPRDLVEAYDDRRMLDTSALWSRLQASALPIWWDVRGAEEREAGQGDSSASLFEEHGLPCHLACSAADADAQRYIVSFSGDRDRPTASEMAELSTIGAHMVEHLRVVDRTQDEDGPTLTPRQAEALTWVARGKTSAEVATIMGISPATVDTYLETVLERLDSVSRAQAVAAALRAGLIE